MNENNNWNWKIILMIVVILLLLILIPPIIVNYGISNCITVSGDTTDLPWIGFWGSYLGGLLGSIAALIALFETRRQSRLQQLENDENRRLSVMPALELSCRPLGSSEIVKGFFIFNPDEPDKSFVEQTKEGYYTFSSKQEAILSFTNIGLGPAFNLNISYNENMPVKIGGLKAGQTNEYALKCFFTPGKDASFIFYVSFSDILGNTYKQSHTMIVSKNELFFSAASTPSKQVLGSGEKGHSESGEKGQFLVR